jgi:hypothetical protein
MEGEGIVPLPFYFRVKRRKLNMAIINDTTLIPVRNMVDHKVVYVIP